MQGDGSEEEDDDDDDAIVALAAGAPRQELLNENDAKDLLDALMR